MDLYPIFCAGSTPAVRFAAEYLRNNGIRVTSTPVPFPCHILLDVPAFQPDGTPRREDIWEAVLSKAPDGTVLFGGRLKGPEVARFRVIDLLDDPEYLAENAAITAHCALSIAAQLLPVTLADAHPLVLGWGRIGKCLARLLKGLGAEVTVCARKDADRAMLTALGYRAVPFSGIRADRHRLILNTVPAPVLPLETIKNTVMLDLATGSGLKIPGMIRAGGLPGIHAPESSGILIGQTVLRLLQEGNA